MGVKLKTLTVKGFMTIRELVSFEPRPLNVLIGANGAGKSNFISFFRLLGWMMASPGNLQEHVAALGGAGAILHDGAGVTREIEADMTLQTEQGENDYAFRLGYAAKDTLIFMDERYRFSMSDATAKAPWRHLGAGHREANLIVEAEKGERTARTILGLLRRCVVFQFHNTSRTSRMRGKWATEDARYLKEDGGNLGAFLLRLRENEPDYYRRILHTIRLVLPFFADFDLEPVYGKVLLQWREHGTDVLFNASQASDGMLRVMALIALLGQPERDLPDVLILDEPELGQHPYAINVIVGMLRSASHHVQVFVATQSTALLDQFDPEDIVVVDRRGRESIFTRQDQRALQFARGDRRYPSAIVPDSGTPARLQQVPARPDTGDGDRSAENEGPVRPFPRMAFQT